MFFKKMSDERQLKIAFNYKTNLKKKPGRPRKKWMENIKKVMRDRSLEEEWTPDLKKRIKFL